MENNINMGAYGIMYCLDMGIDPESIAGFNLEDFSLLESLGLCRRNASGKIEKIDQDESELKLVFDEFRRMYPGTKNGLEPEWANFKKKHKKEWKKIVPILKENLLRQIAERQRKASVIKAFESQKKFNHGLYLESWRHLSTYLNNSNWTMVYFEEEPEPEHPILYQQYLAWTEKFLGRRLESFERLTVELLEDWKNCQGIFKQRLEFFSPMRSGLIFAEIHNSYLDETGQKNDFSEYFQKAYLAQVNLISKK